MSSKKQAGPTSNEVDMRAAKETNGSDEKKTLIKDVLSALPLISLVVLLVIMLTSGFAASKYEYSNRATVTNNTSEKAPEENKKIREEELIWDVLGLDSALENVGDLADEKLVFPESENLTVGSKITRRDDKNNFYVITEDITLKSGIKEDEWGKYVINDDGVLYKDRKKSEGGIGIASVFNKEAKNSSWYSSYGILYLMQNLDIISNLGINEKYSYQELEEKEDNFMAIQTLSAMWGVYADGVLTTDSETLIVVVGEPMTDEEIESRQAQWNKEADSKPYVRITLKNISEVYILNFDFKLDEETQNFVNKWGATVKKNR